MSQHESNELIFTSFRPPGPPKVWSIIDGVKKDEKGKNVKFIIQEIPEDRYDDVVEYMCTYFIPDEPVCKSQNAKDDPEYIQNFRDVWRNVINQGLSVGAFVEDPNGGKPIIAGANILGVDFQKDDHSVEEFKMTSEKARNVLKVIMDLSKQALVYEKYNVDSYMFAFGLSVHPSYRGQALGGHILRVREKIGKEYKIPVTSTAFTSPISQKLAARCGYEVLLEREYKEILDSEGNLAFPNIDVKEFKIMARPLY